MSTKAKTTVQWTARIIIAVILLQTLYFKFTAHPESVTLFTQLGMEPRGRIGIGIAELVVSLLLLFGNTILRALGALGSLGLMLGAVYFHLMYLGIDALFVMAVIVIICAVSLLIVDKTTIFRFIKKYTR